MFVCLCVSFSPFEFCCVYKPFIFQWHPSVLFSDFLHLYILLPRPLSPSRSCFYLSVGLSIVQTSLFTFDWFFWHSSFSVFTFFLSFSVLRFVLFRFLLSFFLDYFCVFHLFLLESLSLHRVFSTPGKHIRCVYVCEGSWLRAISPDFLFFIRSLSFSQTPSAPDTRVLKASWGFPDTHVVNENHYKSDASQA